MAQKKKKEPMKIVPESVVSKEEGKANLARIIEWVILRGQQKEVG